jgi:YegS/Rv2252/BmrU family lipid kinase
MKRVLLITNPVASRHDPSVPRVVTNTLARYDVEVDVAGTTRHGDAARIAAQGVAAGVDVIAVYGGDGTTMQTVTGMMGSGIPLALIPGGTGNLLAGNLRIPRNAARAARLVIEGVRRSIDVGAIQRPEGMRHFAVACGAGIDAMIMKGATHSLKKRFGMAAYVISTFGLLNSIKPVRHRVTVDGVVIDANAITVVIANCGEVGPLFFTLGRDVSIDDGLLDVVVLSATGIVGSIAAMWDLFRGSTGGVRLIRARGRQITIEPEVERPVQMDGELAGVTPLTATVLQKSIDVLVRPAAAGRTTDRQAALPAAEPAMHIKSR